MSRNTMLRASLAVIMMIGVATACSKEQRQEIVDDTVEVAARNVASEGGALEFAKSDIDVDGDLDCTADAQTDARRSRSVAPAPPPRGRASRWTANSRSPTARSWTAAPSSGRPTATRSSTWTAWARPATWGPDQVLRGLRCPATPPIWSVSRLPPRSDPHEGAPGWPRSRDVRSCNAPPASERWVRWAWRTSACSSGPPGRRRCRVPSAWRCTSTPRSAKATPPCSPRPTRHS